MTKNNSDILIEVETLCSELVEGTLDEAKTRRLEQLVRENPVAKRTYIEYFNLHAALHHYNAANLTNVVASSDSEEEDVPVAAPPIPTKALFMPNPILPWGVLIGVVVVVFFTGAWIFQSWQNASGTGTTSDLAKTAQESDNLNGIPSIGDAEEKTIFEADGAEYVAELIWPKAIQQKNKTLPATTSKLAKGEILRVQSEDVQVRFGCGALVTLHGPAVFHVKSSTRGELEFGSLEAKVPPQATGFLIDTPATRVVDLGTEFGLAVGENGETNVKVLDGEVETESRRPVLTAPEPRRLLREGDALFFKPPLTESLRVDFDRPDCLNAFDIVRPDSETFQLDPMAGLLNLRTRDGDICKTANSNRNFLVLPAPECDFEAVLYVKRFMPVRSPQHLSLCVLNDQDNLYRVSYWIYESKKRGFAFNREAEAEQTRPLNRDLSDNPAEVDDFVDMADRPFRLRLLRRGNEISAYWATETGPWIPHGKVTWDRQPRFVGFYAADGFYKQEIQVDCLIDAFELKLLPPESEASGH